MIDEKNRYKHSVARTALAQGVGTAVSEAFSKLMIAVGWPAAVVLKPLVRGATIGLMNECYDDVTKRALSKRENEKVDLLSKTSLQTFMELAERDGVTAINMQIDEGQLQYAYEVSEELMLAAIRQSEDKKVEILGRYYGKTFYDGKVDWQDMHQVISMAATLTYRQIVLIRLICERFNDINPEWFINNNSACVEINRMRDYGLWKTDMTLFKIDASAGIQLKMLKSTDYARMVCEALMLEKLTDNDLKRTIESLAISENGEPAAGFTQEDYEASNTWHYDEGESKLTVGKKISDVATSPEDMTLLLREKDMMKTATDSIHEGEPMKGIDCIISALAEFKKCKSDVLYQSSVDDALKELIKVFEGCEKEGGLRILRGKRQDYKDVISDLNSEYLQKCLDYLSKSEEKEESFDDDLYNKEIDSWFKKDIT